MPALRQRGSLLFTTVLLIGALAGCSLIGFGVHMRTIHPPSVLIDTSAIWVGDICQSTETLWRADRCAPIYTLDVVVRGPAPRHYRVLTIPLR